VKKVKTAGDYTIYQKRSGRYAVQDSKRQWVKGDDKAKILVEADLIKLSGPNPNPPAPAEDAPAEDAPVEAPAEAQAEG
jgi:hypothetical protein